MIKHTYQPGQGHNGLPVWREQGEEMVSELTVTDEMDSVSLHIAAESQGLRAPTVEITAGVRISYADTFALRARLDTILAKHKAELDAQLAESAAAS